MVKVIRRFFDFCGETNRKKFVASIWLGVLIALFEALKIPAIAVMMRALWMQIWWRLCRTFLCRRRKMVLARVLRRLVTVLLWVRRLTCRLILW